MVTRLRAGDLEIERSALDKDVRRTLDILTEVFGPAQQRTFAVRLWNGMEERGADGAEPRFVLVLNRPDSLRRMLLPATERRVAEAFQARTSTSKATSRRPPCSVRLSRNDSARSSPRCV